MLAFLGTRFGRGVLAAVIISATLLATWSSFTLLRHALAKAQGAAAEQTAAATVAKGQTAATQSAADTTILGVRRDARTDSIHEEHAHAIASTHGADAPIDRALNDTGRRQLCDYAAYQGDPECDRLRGAHPAQLPDSGARDTTTPY